MDRTENQRVRYVLIVLQKLCHRKSNRNRAALTVVMRACQAIICPAESSTVVIAIARISLLKVRLTTDITSFLKTLPLRAYIKPNQILEKITKCKKKKLEILEKCYYVPHLKKILKKKVNYSLLYQYISLSGNIHHHTHMSYIRNINKTQSYVEDP